MNEKEEKVMSVYVIHSLPLMMSVIQIFVEDKMVLVGHLVGQDTIGYEESLGLATQAGLSAPWRAMLLKDNDGDVGICLAQWEGFKTGRPGVSGTRDNPGIKYCGYHHSSCSQ